MSSQIPDSWEKRFWIFFGVSLVLRLYLALSLDLTPDEAYYWELARHLDLSYFDHPPMVAFCISLSKSILGDIPLAVRLPALIAFSVVLHNVFLIGKNLSGKSEVGFLGSLLIHASPVGVALGFITTPDAPLALFWSWGIRAFTSCLARDGLSDWLFLGFCLGCGAMAKYNMIFFVPGVAAVILLFKEKRGLIVTPRFWGMVFLAFAGAFPVLYWNHTHDWISLKFQFNHGFKSAGRGFWDNLGEFIGGQLGTIGLTLYPVLIWQGCVVLIRSWREGDEKRFILTCLSMPMALFFIINGTKSKVEANWPQVAYLGLMPLAAEWILAGVDSRRLKWTLGPSAILGAIAIFQAITLLAPIPPGWDISTRLHGWIPMGERIKTLDAEKNRKPIYIGQGAPFTALIGFYGKIDPERLLEIHGTGNWKFWGAEKNLGPDSEVVYVDDNNNSEAIAYGRLFRERIGTESFDISFNGRYIRTINLTKYRGYIGGLSFR